MRRLQPKTKCQRKSFNAYKNRAQQCFWLWLFQFYFIHLGCCCCWSFYFYFWVLYCTSEFLYHFNVSSCACSSFGVCCVSEDLMRLLGGWFLLTNTSRRRRRGAFQKRQTTDCANHMSPISMGVAATWWLLPLMRLLYGNNNSSNVNNNIGTPKTNANNKSQM